MGLLPDLVQVFTVDSAAFIASINEMTTVTDRLAASIDAVTGSADRLSGSADTTAAADDRVTESSTAAAEAIARQSKAVYDLIIASGELAGACDDAALAIDRENLALDRVTEHAAEADASTGMVGGHGKVAFLGLAAAAGYSVVKAAEYQSEMTKLLTQAGVAKKQFKDLEQGVLTLASQVGQSPDSLAQSLYHVESNFESLGIKAPKALQLVKIAAEGANVGGANLVDVTNALTAAVASGIPGVSNFSQAMGALNSIVGAGDMSMQDLADAFGTGMVAVVKGYGLSLKDVGAALDVFGDNNIRGAKAGTDLRMSVQALAEPVATGATELKKLGLTSSTLATDMRHGGLLTALDDLQSRFRKTGISAKEQGKVITDLFGKRAGVGIALLMDQMDRLRSKYPAIAKGAHDFGKAWATTQQTVDQKFKEFKSSLDSLAISFGSVLLPSVTKVLGDVNKFLQFLEKHPLLAEFAGGLVALGVAMGVLSGAMSAVAVIAGAWLPAVVIAGVIALGVAVYEAYKHCKVFRDAIADVAHFFVGVWNSAVHAAGAVVHWFVTGPLAFIKQELAVFSKWWAQNGQEIEKIARVVWDTIATLIRIDWDMIKGVLEVGLDVLKTIWNVAWAVIYNVVKTVWNVIATVVQASIRMVLDVISVVLDIIQGKWGQAWDHLKDLVSTALHEVIDVIKEITSGFGHLLWDAGKALIEGLIDGIKSMFSAATGAIGDLASGVVGAAKSALKIFSPSRVFHDIGAQVGQGLADGMTDSTSLVGKSAAALARAAAYAAEHAATLAADRLKEMHTIGLGLRAGILADLRGTAADVKSAVAKIAEYIQEAVSVGDIGYGRGMSMTEWVERDNRRLQGLATKRAAIMKTIAAADKYATATAQATESWTGLSNLTSVTNAANGGGLYSGDMEADLKANLAQIRQFESALKKLSNLGLDKNLLNQIIQMGPTQGLQVAEALLDGPVSVIKQMDQTQTQINQASKALGRSAAESMYDSGKDAGRGFLSGLEHQQRSIEKMMEKIARSMVKTIRRELGISSPSTVGIYHGQMWAEGIAVGIDRGSARVALSAKNLTGALTGPVHGASAGAAGSSGSGNMTIGPINVHVSGFVGDSRQLATQIFTVMQQETLKYNKRNGGTNNGLSLANSRFG